LYNAFHLQYHMIDMEQIMKTHAMIATANAGMNIHAE
jgi:hypothetical protein